MFPWVTKSATVSTIISVVHTAQGDPDFEELLHFQYWYKIPFPHTDNVNHQENWCEEYDFKALTSKDDLVSFDASGTINGGLPLWNDNDPAHPNTPLFADSYALNVDGAIRAYLLVDNNTPNIAQIANNNDTGTLYGEAMVVELTTGAAWGYVAFNSEYGGTHDITQDDPVYFNNNDDFSTTDNRDLLGEVINDDEETQTVF
jgi:hypothetical protein